MKYSEKLEARAARAEQLALSADIISAFKCRGWALYPMPGRSQIYSLHDLAIIADYGPEETDLKPNLRYLPLPLLQKGDNNKGKAVVKAAEDCVEQGRYPRYAEFAYSEKEGGIIPVGTGAIDSIEINSPNLEINIEPRLPHYGLDGFVVMIPLEIAVAKIMTCITKSFRDRGVRYYEQK